MARQAHMTRGLSLGLTTTGEMMLRRPLGAEVPYLGTMWARTSSLCGCLIWELFVCHHRLPVGSIVCHIPVRCRAGVGCVAEPTEVLGPIVAKPETLTQPFPIAPSLQTCCSWDYGPSCQTVSPVPKGELRAVVPAIRSHAVFEALHAPCKHLEQRIEGAIS